jgi:hypothetical protein
LKQVSSKKIGNKFEIWERQNFFVAWLDRHAA